MTIFQDFLLAAGSASLMLFALVAFFWLTITAILRRVNKGKARQILSQKEEAMEKVIDEEVAAIRIRAGKVPPPPITS